MSLYECVPWCAHVGTTESTGRNTEKTLVKGKRPPLPAFPIESTAPLAFVIFSLSPFRVFVFSPG
ncbi:hypothetical protein X777_09943 [Ooceraea biroi]|uniref:Uncharacterized protein n=1 Tax=Ooceraea biroi TaxID=2015173 RepID=A0A026W6K7_OOCBI|nr:hypothetical protein X777_09943 [Ooceraea biroi]